MSPPKKPTKSGTDSFAVRLTAEVREHSKRLKIDAGLAFLYWFAVRILDLSEDDALEAISVEGANDKGIDLFWVDDGEGRVIIVQGKYSPNLNIIPKESHVSILESSLNWLTNPEALRREGKIELAEAATEYVESQKKGYGVELWYIYTGAKSKNIEKKILVFNQNPENLTRQRSFRHYYIGNIRSAWEEIVESPHRITGDMISVLDSKVIDIDGKFGKALVASLSAKELVRLYSKYGDQLFDRNVRLYLGARKGSVNAGMAETLNEIKQAGNFWAFNNGVTFVCDSFDWGGELLEIKNFNIINIINGCQTTVSISQASTISPDVYVLARFIAAPDDIVEDVIRFNNSQNPIKLWDIASQHKTQRRLKTEFDRLDKPYIYLTRRGARPTKQLGKYRGEDRRLRLIQFDVAGQYAAAFRGDPVLAWKHKGFIFSTNHDDVFPSDVSVEEVLFQWICGEICRKVVRTAISERDIDDVRILKKGGTLFVLATVSQILTLRNGATYLSKVDEGGATSKKSHSRLKKYATFALEAYLGAIRDEMVRDDLELPTLVRSRDFYQKVAKRVERTYRMHAIARKWLDEALPTVGA